jgi:glycosyltransferase involved in cell wall biosynthesis
MVKAYSLGDGSRMIVAFDDQCFKMQLLGGVSRYNAELMTRLQRLDDVHVVWAPGASWNTFDPRGREGLRTRVEYRVRGYVLGAVSLVTGKNLSSKFMREKENRARWISEQSFDIFHPTYYDPYFLPHLHGRPFVLTVHDMIHEIVPELFSPDDSTSSWKAMLAMKASRVITVSENTKRDLMRFCSIDDSNISVVHLASSLDASIVREGPSEPWREWRYLLFVGNRSGCKSFFFMLRSLQPMLKDMPDLRIVCVGGGPFSEAEAAFFRSAGLNSRVTKLQADDANLASIYAHAEALIFPSLYEGFGLPILEAFQCGCPVIASRTSSIPEVGADAVLYFEPRDPLSMRDAALRVLIDTELRQRLIERGKERASFFSWERTTKETKVVYEKVLADLR